MEIYEIILLSLLGLVVLFLAVLIIRALAFKPYPIKKVADEPIEFDKKRAEDSLSKLVSCKTISYKDSSLEDNAEFDKLVGLLPKLFPTVFKTCEYLELKDRAILLKWKGKSNLAPSVFMSHYDVVPALEEKWTKPAFSGIIEDGKLWGRGTLDTKVTLNSALFSAETLINQGFVPENDVYFAFSGNEEISGNGAVRIVDYFEENNIVPALVLDEGGAVVENVFPGVKSPCALIGIAEKGMINVEYKVNSNGGHASAPKPHTPIGMLANAVCKVENNPFPFYITKPVKLMFDTLGRHSTFVYRLIFANLWCFKGILNSICKKSGGELNALVRTTVAFTMAKGSQVTNVIPPEATVVSNLRLNPYDTVDGGVERLKKVIDDQNVIVTALEGNNPSRISVVNSDGYKKIESAILSTWKGSIVSPYLMVQCSDSRHYGRISDKVYRFSSMDLTKEERASIHGNDEAIRLETLHRSVEFYIKVMKQC